MNKTSSSSSEWLRNWPKTSLEVLPPPPKKKNSNFFLFYSHLCFLLLSVTTQNFALFANIGTVRLKWCLCLHRKKRKNCNNKKKY